MERRRGARLFCGLFMIAFFTASQVRSDHVMPISVGAVCCPKYPAAGDRAGKRLLAADAQILIGIAGPQAE